MVSCCSLLVVVVCLLLLLDFCSLFGVVNPCVVSQDVRDVLVSMRRELSTLALFQLSFLAQFRIRNALNFADWRVSAGIVVSCVSVAIFFRKLHPCLV